MLGPANLAQFKATKDMMMLMAGRRTKHLRAHLHSTSARICIQFLPLPSHPLGKSHNYCEETTLEFTLSNFEPPSQPSAACLISMNDTQQDLALELGSPHFYHIIVPFLLFKHQDVQVYMYTLLSDYFTPPYSTWQALAAIQKIILLVVP